MITLVRRLDMQLKCEPEFLAQLMKHRGYTVRGLADAVEREVRKKNRRFTCSHSTIGHLRTGKRKNASPELARAIEDLLSEPRGSLFATQVSNVQREVRGAA